jgi:hypothetical protein
MEWLDYDFFFGLEVGGILGKSGRIWNFFLGFGDGVDWILEV